MSEGRATKGSLRRGEKRIMLAYEGPQQVDCPLGTLSFNRMQSSL